MFKNPLTHFLRFFSSFLKIAKKLPIIQILVIIEKINKITVFWKIEIAQLFFNSQQFNQLVHFAFNSNSLLNSRKIIEISLSVLFEYLDNLFILNPAWSIDSKFLKLGEERTTMELWKLRNMKINY